MLHGYSDDYTKWAQGGVVGGLSDQYETFVSSELVEYVDRNYKTIADRMGRSQVTAPSLQPA